MKPYEYSVASELEADAYDAEFRASRVDHAEECPPCTCNSPHLCVHALWCDQYKFWNI